MHRSAAIADESASVAEAGGGLSRLDTGLEEGHLTASYPRDQPSFRLGKPEDHWRKHAKTF
jgi:hypothetical protein